MERLCDKCRAPLVPSSMVANYAVDALGCRRCFRFWSGSDGKLVLMDWRSWPKLIPGNSGVIEHCSDWSPYTGGSEPQFP
jgi:hypothetical protein